MSQLRPLSEVHKVRDILFKQYLKILNPPSSFVEELDLAFDKELEYYTMLKPMYMPHYLYVELERLGFDLSLNKLDETF